MGLREINAARTRELITDAAMALFGEQGFDATTMEDVATHVGIGTSTLYRYFPTKETLATAPLGDPTLMAQELTGRPEDEPLDVALGHASLAMVTYSTSNPERTRALEELVAENHKLVAPVLQWLHAADAALAAAIAARPGHDLDEVEIAAASWMVIFATQQMTKVKDDGPEAQRHVLEHLHERTVVVPRLP